MSELFDKQVNAEKEKTSGVHRSSRKPKKKCAMKMKLTRKNDANVVDGRKYFIGCIRKSHENEGTICLVNR